MKRKLNDHTYYQCDYTGIIMNQPNCYMPVFVNGAIKKRGNYCNWEAVLLHAKHLLTFDKMTDEAFDFVLSHVGTLLELSEDDITKMLRRAPFYTALTHVGGELTPEKYQEACNYVHDDCRAVLINLDGTTEQVGLIAHNGRYDQLDGYQEYRMPGKGKNAANIIIFSENMLYPRNMVASKMFNTPSYLHGKVIVVRYTKEVCFLDRTRIINYELEHFLEEYVKKRKRAKRVEAISLEPGDCKAILSDVTNTLAEYEKTAAQGAVLPAKLAKASKLVPADGKQLARLKKLEQRLEQHEAPAEAAVMVPVVV